MNHLKIIIMSCTSIVMLIAAGCGNSDNSEVIELQATVLALVVEDKAVEPLPTYIPLPTYTPLPTYIPLPTYTPLPVLAPQTVYVEVEKIVEVLKEVPVEVIKEVQVEVEVEVIKEVEVIVEVTPTPTSIPTPTPTPSGYTTVSSMSGINSLGNGGSQGVFTGLLANPSDFDKYQFYGYSGQTITVSMLSSDLDSKLDLLDASENLITRNDDHDGGTNAHITRLLTSEGVYIILAQSATMSSSDYGDYSINFYLTPRQ